MNPDLWYRPEPTLTWPAEPGLRQRDPGAAPPGHEAGHAADAGHPDPAMPATFTLVFTAPQPDGAPPGAGHELGQALIAILDGHLGQQQARWETDFEGEPLL